MEEVQKEQTCRFKGLFFKTEANRNPSFHLKKNFFKSCYCA